MCPALQNNAKTELNLFHQEVPVALEGAFLELGSCSDASYHPKSTGLHETSLEQLALPVILCVPMLSWLVGQAQIPAVLPKLGCWDPSVLEGCGCPHPQILIFFPLLLKQNKKMKRKHQEKVKEWRRDSFGHFSPVPCPPGHWVLVMVVLALYSFAAEEKESAVNGAELPWPHPPPGLG